ncbi:hypothetical protein ONV78_17245 [Hahella sp. CR1]|uniref:hypothetical protein n=1 Tax=Hahella sp. CR1 TaxID=2992807 RepID=UPI002442E30E|nr:hypothetical protein [Hahella sp. CR1]MDG9669489.1 hypothetical protein [Hahella sp. CR1]
MKGLYINVTNAKAEVELFSSSIGAPSDIHEFDSPLGAHILVDVHRANWPEGVAYADEASRSLAVGCGHFVFNGRLGNISEFARAFFRAETEEERTAVCSLIEAGSYLFYIETGGEYYLVTDPFALVPHFQDVQSETLRVAPAPCYIADDKDVDPVLQNILNIKRHLFGGYTLFKGVERLEVGAIMSRDRTSFYFDYLNGSGDLHNVNEKMRKGMGIFGDRKKILPLSGGLDSRYLLSLGKTHYGYTYGPANTGDRPVARKFAGFFDDYREFSLLDLSYPKLSQQLGEKMFKGLVSRPLSELLVVYRHFYEAWGDGNLFVDGYLGGTLQRGYYFNIESTWGTLFRIFPSLMFRFITPEDLIRYRYRQLDAAGKELLLNNFHAATARFNCDGWKKIFLYEALYGRSGRWITHGGCVMASQFFTPVQPFVFFDVFRTFMSLDVRKFNSFSLLSPLWKTLPKGLSDVATLDLYRPLWPAMLNRCLHVASRTTDKLSLSNRFDNYKEELPKVQWE